MMNRLTRRHVLRLLGLAGGSYAASSLGRPIARASGAVVPKRIVFFYTEQGTLKQFNADGTLKPFWSPNAPNAPDPLTLSAPWSTTDFTLRDLHTPLVPYQNGLVFLDGIDMVSSWVDPTPSADAHHNGTQHALIGANRQTASLAGGPSIDQVIAQGLAANGNVTALPSLQMAVSWSQLDQDSFTPIYVAGGQPLTVPGSPTAVYQSMLPNGPMSSQSTTAATLALAQQKSVLDFVQSDFTALSSQLGTLDKQRIDSHASAIRDLEQRLGLSSGAQCVQPPATIVNSATDGNTGANYTSTAAVLMQLAQVALACDMTRVLTFYLQEAPEDLFGYTSINGTDSFHTMVHETNGPPGTQPLLDNQDAINIVKAYHNTNAGLFVQFLNLLSNIQEADGSTLLDNTMVVWCGQIAGGDHSLDRVPYILAGGLAGALTLGRYVLFPRKPTTVGPQFSQGPAHNDFLLSLANMMGIQATTFGNPSVCTGPLTGWTS